MNNKYLSPFGVFRFVWKSRSHGSFYNLLIDDGMSEEECDNLHYYLVRAFGRLFIPVLIAIIAVITCFYLDINIIGKSIAVFTLFMTAIILTLMAFINRSIEKAIFKRIREFKEHNQKAVEDPTYAVG